MPSMIEVPALCLFLAFTIYSCIEFWQHPGGSLWKIYKGNFHMIVYHFIVPPILIMDLFLKLAKWIRE